MTKSKLQESSATAQEADAETPQCLTFTVEEAAALLGIGRSLAYNLASSGELPGVRKLGRRLVVGRAALLAFLGEVAA